MKVAFLRVIYLSLLFTANGIYAQNKHSNINIGKTHTIKSKILKSDRTIQIYLPENYEQSDRKYPVLYILDGQWHFTNGVAIQQSLRALGHLPEMIVIGIKTTNPLRRTLMGNEQERFLNFLENEVISYVDQTLRTSNDRVLFGWETAAFFANYVILHEKQLFNAAIITNGAYASEEMVEKFDHLTMTSSKYLFMANSTKDIYSIKYSDSFSQLLTKRNPNNLIWKYQQFNEKSQRTGHGNIKRVD